ncbi:hypothetical protein TNIN_127371 [Trichonephila inaurata madagascariensis]|uniref:Uncharacterized protein n=1 Tax=Trichonephila inaurata madagascariensis TaxID=2747483 RepID=A0A8X6MJR8_9ARAC|nr:hypothetical protein TNIN_127371 [Trichonephila inaurata madagascariensis]
MKTTPLPLSITPNDQKWVFREESIFTSFPHYTIRQGSDVEREKKMKNGILTPQTPHEHFMPLSWVFPLTIASTQAYLMYSTLDTATRYTSHSDFYPKGLHTVALPLDINTRGHLSLCLGNQTTTSRLSKGHC